MLTLSSGAVVRIATLGEGPSVVLIHGYPDNLQIWSRVAPRLAANFTIHAVDWPGLGHSQPWSGGATPYHLADQIECVLDALDVTRSHVVGLDMGGQPALLFAARHPDRVLKTVVTNSLVMADGPTSLDIKFMRDLRWNRFALRRLYPIVFLRALVTFLSIRHPISRDLS